MARYIRDEQINKPEDFVSFMMNDFLTKNGFKQKELKGELVWQDGTGMLAPPKFFKYTYYNGVIHIEAWVKTAWLPGVYTGENAMTGFMGTVPKQAYKKSVDELIALLHQPLPSDGSYASAQGVQQTQPGPIPVQGVDTSRYATMGLVFSLIGLVGAFLIPLVGIIFGAMGLTYGKKSSASAKGGMAKAAFVIGIIALIFGIVIWVLNFMITIGAL